uniref:Uncharacterized protein n=1 Tax=Candidatus Kentrum sp. TUN TaxID=2126343 RepID=A0A450Z8W3_9GAMM|nr:MAG: hypothetical protein BECKTUN1418E_GA0071001_100162 [Candidatus Kentron sp. TUN]VFK51307.1 MAG: hypothetical protein BECKTUN1418F_GA0071002_100162 [Candidatus Kentron sp. TUN]
MRLPKRVGIRRFLREDFQTNSDYTINKVLPVLAYLVDSAVRSFAPRGYVYQPRVAAQQLLWEGEHTKIQPQRGCVKGAWENNDATLSGLLA